MSYPLFQSHLDFAHDLWKKILIAGDTAIDATCGNGHDTIFLAKILNDERSTLFAIDIQEDAIKKTEDSFKNELPSPQLSIKFVNQCHSSFPQEIQPHSVKLIVYNLGYLPKGDKALTTLTESTLKSIESAKNLICDGGVISITCYPGHDEGLKEEEALLDYFAQWNRFEWNCSYHRWVNRFRGPTLLLIQKKQN